MTATAQDCFDAIVIGSGMGGLSAASLLAQLYGRRVLVLERHYTLGGYTHTFARAGGWEWDVGLHYVGGMQEEGLEHDAMQVVTGGNLTWQPMADPFERLVFPGGEFAMRSGREKLFADLVAAFPAERETIHGYFRDVDRALGYFGLMTMNGLLPEPIRRVMMALRWRSGRLARMTTGHYLDAHFRDPFLRSILGARWPDFGLPPAASAFLIHAIIARHYFGGGSYPIGGAAGIAEGASAVIRAHGGELQTRAQVERILVEGGRAVGVRLDDGREYRSKVVISDAGASRTYLDLLPEGTAFPFRQALSETEPGFGAVVVFYGLKSSPQALDVHGENFWLHTELDQDAMFAKRNTLGDGRAPLVYLSFPSLKDPAALMHTAQAMAPLDQATLARWQSTPWHERGEEYEKIKQRMCASIELAVEARLPGFGALVAHREVATPLSFQHFTGHAGGACYGRPFVPARVDERWMRAKTPIPGLFLTGTDAAALGVVGALMGGVVAAAAVEGAGTLKKIRRAARTPPVSEWFELRVASKRLCSPEILEIELESADARPLPGWRAGAHVEVRLGHFLVRAYSLCGAPSPAPGRYRLGILLEPRGSASQLWRDVVREGARLRARAPQDSFVFDEARGALLLAGGIGVTPLLSMAHRAAQLGRRVSMHYSVRSESRAVFTQELRHLLSDRFTLHTDDRSRGAPIDLALVLGELADGADLYVCGPPAFLRVTQEAATHLGIARERIHYESFGAEQRPGDQPFQVRLRRSNRSFTVPAERTLGATLQAQGIDIPHLCGTGQCGTCVIRAVSGDVEHRDSVLTPTQHARGEIAVCVSRAHGELLLDL